MIRGEELNYLHLLDGGVEIRLDGGDWDESNRDALPFLPWDWNSCWNHFYDEMGLLLEPISSTSAVDLFEFVELKRAIVFNRRP